MRGLLVAVLLAAGAVLSLGAARPRPSARDRAGRSEALRAAWVRGVDRLRARGRRGPDVAPVLVELAARLRAGADLPTAVRRSLPSPGPPWGADLVAAAGASAPVRDVRAPPDRPRRRAWRAARTPPSARADVLAAVAAARLAQRTGAPLADVIDVVVAGIAEAGESEALRRTALAGPRASARLLAWLPLAGLGLGTVVGADPVAVLLGGGIGGLCLVLGAALFLLGRSWVRALVADAERSAS